MVINTSAIFWTRVHVFCETINVVPFNATPVTIAIGRSVSNVNVAVPSAPVIFGLTIRVPVAPMLAGGVPLRPPLELACDPLDGLSSPYVIAASARTDRLT